MMNKQNSSLKNSRALSLPLSLSLSLFLTHTHTLSEKAFWCMMLATTGHMNVSAQWRHHVKSWIILLLLVTLSGRDNSQEDTFTTFRSKENQNYQNYQNLSIKTLQTYLKFFLERVEENISVDVNGNSTLHVRGPGVGVLSQTPTPRDISSSNQSQQQTR